MRAAAQVARAADDELIQVEEFGEPGGMPVLVHAGSPGSRRLFRPDAELAVRGFGLRLLSYDRPGYGGRPRRQGRRIADAVTDVRCIAGPLGIGRLGVWGFSGGGAYALACAALLPELVTGAAVFASFAPYGSPGLDFCAGWPPEYRAEVDLFFADRRAARQNWRQDAGQLLAALSAPEGWMAAGAPPPAPTTPAARRWPAISPPGPATPWPAVTMAGGTTGRRRSPLGRDLSDIRVPVRLWHGARDRAVPVAHGHWLAAHVPGLAAHLPESQDHTNIEHNNRQAAYARLSGLP